jgi:hypothetical protein
MVVVYVDIQSGLLYYLSEFPDSAYLARIDQDKTGDAIQIHVFHPFGLEYVNGGPNEKVP